MAIFQLGWPRGDRILAEANCFPAVILLLYYNPRWAALHRRGHLPGGRFAAATTSIAFCTQGAFLTPLGARSSPSDSPERPTISSAS